MDYNDITEVQELCGSIAKDKGFWDAHENLHPVISASYVKLMLIVSELAEAAEELRNIVIEDPTDYAAIPFELSKINFDEKGKPVGFASELTDAVIRLFDLIAYIDFSLSLALGVKLTYNQTRDQLHGRSS